MVKSSNSIVWPAKSQRSLVEWVDEHCGPESDLRLDNKKAIRDLREYLFKHRHNYDFGKKGLSMAEVRRKLEALWEYRLDEHKTASMDVFYNEGSKALNWYKLDTQPIHLDYTDEEIEAFQQRGTGSGGTSADESGDNVDDDMTNVDGGSGRPEKQRRLDQEAPSQDYLDNEQSSVIDVQQSQADANPNSRYDTYALLTRRHSDKNLLVLKRRNSR